MSWQSYIDDQLMVQLPSGKPLKSAAILGQDGSVWAQSPDFPAPSVQEIEGINNGFPDEQGRSSLAEHGLHFGGEKYMVIQGEPHQVIRGKKGQGGICIKKTVSGFVIGIYDTPTAPGECSMLVETLGDYLASQGI